VLFRLAERIVLSASTDAKHEWVQEVFDIMRGLPGKQPVSVGATYSTDCAVLTTALGNPPTVVLGPGEPEMAHQTDEFCYLSKMDLAADAYAEITKAWGEV
jgi:succinyl-diaminopimelate desuccinylase